MKIQDKLNKEKFIEEMLKEMKKKIEDDWDSSSFISYDERSDNYYMICDYYIEISRGKYEKEYRKEKLKKLKDIL